MKKKEQNKGITLIALVISIIVILILAGVTMASLTGNNGVLYKAREARGINVYNQAEEQAKLAYMAVKAEVITAKSTNAEYEAEDDIVRLANIVNNEVKGDISWQVTPLQENVIDNIIAMTYSNEVLKKDEIVKGKPAQDGQIIFEIVLNGQEVELYIDGISVTGRVLPTAGFGDVNIDYKNKFGKKVNGYRLNNGTVEDGKWRLFYADSNSAYLIRDSIGGKSLNSLSWFGESKISTLGKNLNPKFTYWETKADGENLNSNIKGTAALLDTTKWKEYKADFADWAIGGPPLEMYIASYNATHQARLDCKVVQEGTVIGYQIGKNANGGTVTSFKHTVTDAGPFSDMDLAIYRPNAGYWWLSSPCSRGADRVWYASSDKGWILEAYYSLSKNMQVRPLVSVPISRFTTEITITDSY